MAGEMMNLRKENQAVYCPKCGQKTGDDARFCTKCGSPFNAVSPERPQSQSLQQKSPSVCFACYLKTGMLKRDPHILWIDPHKSALICVGQSMTQDFRGYAQSLASHALDAVLPSHPGSILLDTAQIQRLQIIATYDSELHRYDDYERFVMDTAAAKYRGVIERGITLSDFEPSLMAFLGNRYQYRTMEGFPFL